MLCLECLCVKWYPVLGRKKKQLLGITELCSRESPIEVMVKAQLGDTTRIASSCHESRGSQLHSEDML